MNCKRIICILLFVSMLMCLTACHVNVHKSQESESKTTTESKDITESKDTTENKDTTQSQEVTTTESQVTTEGTENQPEEDDTDKIRMLALEKSLYAHYEWDEAYDKALVRSEYSNVTLGQEDAEAFPEMALVLSQIATMQTNAMEDEFDNLVSFAREELSQNKDGFETHVSTLDVQVRRADSVIISLLSDSYSDYGWIENYRVFHGSNYDPRTGEELTLDDVIKEVNNDLAIAVEEELTSHMWTGEFYSEYTVQEYFADTPYHGFNWTLDYIGITFYFAPGELCDEGAQTATLSFAEHPELFYEEYMVVPMEYAIEMPLNISFFAELDADDVLEEISVSGWYDDERNHYMDYGIYTDTDAQYYYEEYYIYDLHPYYVKAADGHYIYLFCEDSEEGLRQMHLKVFSLNEDGSVTKSAEMNISPSQLANNVFIVPTDPTRLILDDLDSGAQKVVFAVGNNGIPTAE